MTRRNLAAAAILAAVALPRAASAYVIQQTTSGKEVRWFYMPEDFLIDTHGYSQITDGTLLDAEKQSFAVWEQVADCDARYTVKTSDRGVGSIFNAGNTPGRDKHSEMAFVETDWGRSGGDSSLIALTFTYFSNSTGKILENDIVANAVDFVWTDGDTGVKTDVVDFLAHEVGHSYGLGHSADPSATMFATGSQGETLKRDLSPDDIAGITHLYPPGCCPHTRTGDLLALLGCNVSLAQGRGGAAAILSLAGLAAAVALRRSRKARVLVGAGVVLVFGLAALRADATIAVDLPLHELFRRSDVVVRGNVVWSEAMTTPAGSIVTLTQVEVVEDFAAIKAPRVVTFLQPGGTPADSDVALHVEGTARFEIGDEVIVFGAPVEGGFAEQFPDAYKPVGFAQGAMRVLRTPGAPARVVRDLGSLDRVDATTHATVAADPINGLSLETLRAHLAPLRP